MSDPQAIVAGWANTLSDVLRQDVDAVAMSRADYPPLKAYSDFCPGDGAMQRFIEYRQLLKAKTDLLYRMYADGFVYMSIHQILVYNDIFDQFVRQVVKMKPSAARYLIRVGRLIMDFPGLLLVPESYEILSRQSTRNIGIIRMLARRHEVFGDPRVTMALNMRTFGNLRRSSRGSGRSSSLSDSSPVAGDKRSFEITSEFEENAAAMCGTPPPPPLLLSLKK